MKSINKTSAAIFQKLNALMGEEGHLKLDNAKGAFMYLAFEKLYPTDFVGRYATVYSMAHYYVLKGDLVPDPDMTFIALNEQPEQVFPMTFQNALTYTETLYKTIIKFGRSRPTLRQTSPRLPTLGLNTLSTSRAFSLLVYLSKNLSQKQMRWPFFFAKQRCSNANKGYSSVNHRCRNGIFYYLRIAVGEG
jgi:hypothetical protein